MRVAFIAAECEPYAKTGGLGDVVDALARALGGLDGRPVDVYLPRYRGMVIPEGAIRSTSRLIVPDPTLPAGTNDVRLVDVAAQGYRLRLIDHPPAFDRDGYYGDAAGDFPDNAWRFGLLCRAALEAIRLDGGIDILHLHDWHACPAVLLREGPYRGDVRLGPAATLLTIHNLAYHGWVPADRVWLLGLDRAPLAGVTPLGGAAPVAGAGSPAAASPAGPTASEPPRAVLPEVLAPRSATDRAPAAAGRLSRTAPASGGWPPGLDPEPGVDLLRAGIERAVIVNTVSPTFAAESLRPEFGMGLDEVLRDRGDRYVGILNGIDPHVWNPATDPDLAAPYDVDAPAGKAVCRRDLLARVGFDPGDDGPVFGAIGRLDPQKGFDLLAAAAPALIADGARLVVQANGDARIAEPFRTLAAAAPTRVALIERFDRVMARRIYAGADLFVMPSRFEPSGQGQMIALRYGTPPVVRRTGGLADSIVDVDADPVTGTGFTFDAPDPDALLAACRRAIAMRGDGSGDPDHGSARTARWRDLVERGMRADFAWESGSAPRYRAAYLRALALAGGTALAEPVTG